MLLALYTALIVLAVVAVDSFETEYKKSSSVSSKRKGLTAVMVIIGLVALYGIGDLLISLSIPSPYK